MRYTGRKTFKMTKNHQFTDFDFIFQKLTEKDGFSSFDSQYFTKVWNHSQNAIFKKINYIDTDDVNIISIGDFYDETNNKVLRMMNLISKLNI